MDTDKLLKAADMMVSLMEAHKKQASLMRQMIYAIAKEHLKQNNIQQTLWDWDLTQAALRLWIGETDRFICRQNILFLSKKMWPTHIRLYDLKPVRVRKGIHGEEGMMTVYELRGKRIAAIMPSDVEKDFVRIREDDD